jgi:hypothetical protein
MIGEACSKHGGNVKQMQKLSQKTKRTGHLGDVVMNKVAILQFIEIC